MIEIILDENLKPLKAGYLQHYIGEQKAWSSLEIVGKDSFDLPAGKGDSLPEKDAAGVVTLMAH